MTAIQCTNTFIALERCNFVECDNVVVGCDNVVEVGL